MILAGLQENTAPEALHPLEMWLPISLDLLFKQRPEAFMGADGSIKVIDEV